MLLDYIHVKHFAQHLGSLPTEVIFCAVVFANVIKGRQTIVIPLPVPQSHRIRGSLITPSSQAANIGIAPTPTLSKSNNCHPLLLPLTPSPERHSLTFTFPPHSCDCCSVPEMIHAFLAFQWRPLSYSFQEFGKQSFMILFIVFTLQLYDIKRQSQWKW